MKRIDLYKILFDIHINKCHHTTYQLQWNYQLRINIKYKTTSLRTDIKNKSYQFNIRHQICNYQFENRYEKEIIIDYTIDKCVCMHIICVSECKCLTKYTTLKALQRHPVHYVEHVQLSTLESPQLLASTMTTSSLTCVMSPSLQLPWQPRLSWLPSSLSLVAKYISSKSLILSTLITESFLNYAIQNNGVSFHKNM